MAIEYTRQALQPKTTYAPFAKASRHGGMAVPRTILRLSP
ncbi:E3 ubiquitin-protein ligase TRIM56-like isoform X2 [Acetobacter orientalis]|uniref:E3 ubiquitin-protein ligase TRIM56-like isoform X2 n=1 Tax=Acetobacter orientalis TaxID=146474 RepID=A0A2Z5ZJJ3_9PROT|nr:E3 ubiquitin-protein ligase TRIM56-like isoform X2 [Acetobacter orientalis]